MKYLVIGNKGYIGSAVESKLKEKNIPVVGTHHKNTSDSYHLDLFNPNLENILTQGLSYAFILGGIAKIKKCTDNPIESYQCNVSGTIDLGKQLREKGIIPVFFSTDYVFDGKNGPYLESSPTSPLNEYGRQKAILEERVQNEFDKYLIIRPGKVYDLKQDGKTLLSEMHNSFQEGKVVKAAFDQFLSPIYINDLVETLVYLAQEQAQGIFHIAGPDIFSRYEIASFIREKMKADEDLLEKISLRDLPESFSRPFNTSMLNGRLPEILTKNFLTIDSATDVLSGKRVEV